MWNIGLKRGGHENNKTYKKLRITQRKSDSWWINPINCRLKLFTELGSLTALGSFGAELKKAELLFLWQFGSRRSKWHWWIRKRQRICKARSEHRRLLGWIIVRLWENDCLCFLSNLRALRRFYCVIFFFVRDNPWCPFLAETTQVQSHPFKNLSRINRTSFFLCFWEDYVYSPKSGLTQIHMKTKASSAFRLILYRLEHQCIYCIYVFILPSNQNLVFYTIRVNL